MTKKKTNNKGPIRVLPESCREMWSEMQKHHSRAATFRQMLTDELDSMVKARDAFWDRVRVVTKVEFGTLLHYDSAFNTVIITGKAKPELKHDEVAEASLRLTIATLKAKIAELQSEKATVRK